MVMFTDTTLVAFVSMGSTGVVSVYDAEIVVAADGAPVVGERVVVAPAVEFGKAGQTKPPLFSASK